MPAPRNRKPKNKSIKPKFTGNAAITIYGQSIKFGATATIHLPVASLFSHTPIHLPVRVIAGKKPGPTLFISGAVHGDEIIGVEIVRRLARSPRIKNLKKGNLILLPILNMFGFILNSRYLQDRRDLNRSFPGSAGGSLASRIANLFMTEVVAKSTHGIDIHAGSFYRENLPQIRANTDDAEILAMASAFAAPAIINSDIRDGSLREAATAKGIKMMVFEAGEALRFDESSANCGVNGVLGVMEHLGMISRDRFRENCQSGQYRHTTWVRAPRAGILSDRAPLGAEVRAGDILAYISDPFGDDPIPILASESGLLIGRSNLPTANEGDGLFHIATSTKITKRRKGDMLSDMPLHNTVHPDH